ncbi:hypothetical protein A3F03_04880 [Candidatus Roizmanbacteria bacterium RIFCSPHIGHO2_12_FULL_41_11]|uniref:Uncharacterized protein n=1 Tax=Candidatus Roizmanbacteria bacterium RIFCSPHIGHO2_12_FULL_41_11 TaxID=1802052 RepID=A0A1F7I2E2_9BACT|nr:MAG: hypothetical protein A3F03_04880 [Candidatus Roizmanbacteria bacterium RIFCSPHIGHO2_12_FULL_41_11]
MMTTTVSAYQVRRNNKPIARLVGVPFMLAVEKLLAADPALAETISIMLDDELMNAIEKGNQQIAGVGPRENLYRKLERMRLKSLS